MPGSFCASGDETNWYGRSEVWRDGRSYSAEQIVHLLRQVEVGWQTGRCCRRPARKRRS
jgi:hypothetical protein